VLTSKEQTFPTTGIAGGFVKLKRTIKNHPSFRRVIPIYTS